MANFEFNEVEIEYGMNAACGRFKKRTDLFYVSDICLMANNLIPFKLDIDMVSSKGDNFMMI